MDDLVKFSKEGLDDFDLNLQVRVLNSHFPEFDQKSFKVGPDLTVEFFISDFTDIDVSTNSNTQSFLLNDFMNILEDLNNLRHNNNLFNNLLQEVGDLDYFFLGRVDWNNLLLKGGN